MLIVLFFLCSFAFRIEIPYCQHFAFPGLVGHKKEGKVAHNKYFTLLRVDEKKPINGNDFLGLIVGFPSLPFG